MKSTQVGNWDVQMEVDEDGHLNIYVKHFLDTTDIMEIETGRGDGTHGEALAFRVTTKGIEERYQATQCRPCAAWASGLSDRLFCVTHQCGPAEPCGKADCPHCHWQDNTTKGIEKEADMRAILTSRSKQDASLKTDKLQSVFQALWQSLDTPILVIVDAEGREKARCREVDGTNVWLYTNNYHELTPPHYEIFNDQQPCSDFNGVRYLDLEEIK